MTNPPAFPSGPPAWPIADDDVRVALEQAYRDGSWGRYRGPHIERLATALAEMHGVEFVTLCSSGTLAVELALRGLTIGAEDEVILAAYDFPGNFRSIEAVGARPVLVDVDVQNWGIDVAAIAEAIGPATKAVIVSHLHGGLVDMSRVMQVARSRGLSVVEDACQAPGATIEGRVAGTWGDVGILSFGGSKLLTAGRGGALLTNHQEVHQRVKVFSDRGNQAFPLSELQAAVLLPQLGKLAQRNQLRRSSVERLRAGMHVEKALRPILNSAIGEASWYKVAWQYDPQAAGNSSREQWIAAMQAEGVAVDAGFRGFAGRSQRRCRKAGSLERSQIAAAATVLLHHPILLEPPAVIDRLAGAFNKVIGELTNSPRHT